MMAGSAPARSSTARSLADCGVKLPLIWPVVLILLLTGGLLPTSFPMFETLLDSLSA